MSFKSFKFKLKVRKISSKEDGDDEFFKKLEILGNSVEGFFILQRFSRMKHEVEEEALGSSFITYCFYLSFII